MAARIAILGGTFDPIHIGHLAIAEDVRVAINADCVLFVPTAQQPLKASTSAATADQRLAMVQFGIADNPAFAVSDLEVRRGGRSYTVDTMAQLRTEYLHTELFFIVGADAAIDLSRWFQVERLLQLCRIVIVERPGYLLDLETLFARLPTARDRCIVVRGPVLEISASELRERLRSGRPVRYHLPTTVRQYIECHNLYRNEPPDEAT